MRVAGNVVQRIFNEGRRSLDIDLPAAGREMNRNCSKPERGVEGREGELPDDDKQYAWIARGRLSRASLEIVPRDKRGVPHQTYANATGELNR